MKKSFLIILTFLCLSCGPINNKVGRNVQHLSPNDASSHSECYKKEDNDQNQSKVAGDKLQNKDEKILQNVLAVLLCSGDVSTKDNETHSYYNEIILDDGKFEIKLLGDVVYNHESSKDDFFLVNNTTKEVLGKYCSDYLSLLHLNKLNAILDNEELTNLSKNLSERKSKGLYYQLSDIVWPLNSKNYNLSVKIKVPIFSENLLLNVKTNQ
ncbi:MAG: hypothetical protein K2X39_03820 [Silvanigrellaceae bacterium]|nr:hypothetical protein [Silvanigrellaceae bacterium]